MEIEESYWKSVQYEYYPVYDRKVNPLHYVRRNYSELFYINWYIRSGQARIITENETLTVGEGNWIFMDPLLVHSHFFSEGSHLVSIWFRVHWKGLDFLPPRLPVQVTSGKGRQPLLSAAEALCRFEEEHPTRGNDYPLSIQNERWALFHGWLSQWHRCREEQSAPGPQSLDPRIARIMEVMKAWPHMAPMDYGAISREVGISRAQCNRIFKQETGMTPRQWCDARCLDQAQNRVAEKKKSIKEIAVDLGFFDASHFSKWFKARTGKAPKDWRSWIRR